MSKILVTGANGFIAAHCISLLLSTNHLVRGTIRSEQKATATRAALSGAGVDIANLELIVISDPTDIAQFAPVVAGCKGILHLASAFTYDAVPGEFEEKLLIPALKGTATVCEAAAKYPEVMKVVIMSSFAAVYDGTLGMQPGRVYSEKDWCPLTYEEGKNASFVVCHLPSSSTLTPRTAVDSSCMECRELIGAANRIPRIEGDSRESSVGLRPRQRSRLPVGYIVPWNGLREDDSPN
jgi:nucleoside-diphosphate-sugar epimerase